MKLEGNILKSKVGRRIVLLFILAALVPIGALAFLSFHEVTRQLNEQSHREMHRDSKALGVLFLERLYLLETDLKTLAERVVSGLGTENGMTQFTRDQRWKRRFKGIVVVTGKQRPFPLLGAIQDIPELSPDQWKYLQRGKTVLATRIAPTSRPRIFLGRLLDRHEAEKGVLMAEIGADALWNLDLIDASMVSVLGPDNELLFSSYPLPNKVLNQAARALSRSSSGWFDWEFENERFLTNYWAIFLQPAFHTPRWTVILTRPEADVLAAMKRFKAIFPPVLLMTILVIALLSQSQIRKYLTPLQQLREATRRVAAKDFKSPVQVKSGDEFEELATSFNAMSARLEKQFSALVTLADIDRIILSAPDARYLVETLLTRIGDVAPCDLVAVGRVQTESQTVEMHIHDRQGAWAIQETSVDIKAEETKLLLASDGYLFWTIEDAPPAYIPPLHERGAHHVVVFPIVFQERLAAILCLGFRKNAAIDPEDLKQARELADRTAVALSNDHQAHYDALTGLPNRLLLRDRLDQALARAARGNAHVAVFFIGVDRFNGINDSLGHGVGDELLKQVARALGRFVSNSDTVARFGGDVFCVVIPDIAPGGNVPSRLAGKILGAFHHPFQVHGQPLRITASVGIAVYPDDANCADDLLKNADSAMNHAKKQGRNNVQFYSGEMNATALERLRLEAHLRRALEREELLLYFQPQMELRTGRIIGAEALIRWRHAEMGMVSPGSFIPLAEETGLIIPIGQWVLGTACAQMKAWQKQGLPPFKVGVNLSGPQFRQPNLVEQMERAISTARIRPDFLDLEITEGTSMGDVKTAIATLHRLKEIGVRISIDDFGTGYSSLSYLKQFPIDTLKIDQSFVRGIPNDAGQMSIVKAIIGLAHSLNLSVLAEGVETEEQLAFLREGHCQEVQGYLIGQPMPADEFVKFLAEKEWEAFPLRRSA